MTIINLEKARAAQYLSRMSTEHQQYSIDNQREYIMKYADDHNICFHYLMMMQVSATTAVAGLFVCSVVFWKLAHWLARKYRTGIASLIRWWCNLPKLGQSKTWVLLGKTNHDKLSGEILYRLVGKGKKRFRWRLLEGNPYLRTEARNTYTSRYTDVVMAFASV